MNLMRALMVLNLVLISGCCGDAATGAVVEEVTCTKLADVAHGKEAFCAGPMVNEAWHCNPFNVGPVGNTCNGRCIWTPDVSGDVVNIELLADGKAAAWNMRHPSGKIFDCRNFLR